MVLEVPQLVPGSPPTVFPERLRVQLKHFGTLVRYPNLVLDALVGSTDHCGGQIWSQKLIFLVSVRELPKEKPRTRRHSLLKSSIGVRPAHSSE